jgi:hypothetical protein
MTDDTDLIAEAKALLAPAREQLAGNLGLVHVPAQIELATALVMIDMAHNLDEINRSLAEIRKRTP